MLVVCLIICLVYMHTQEKQDTKLYKGLKLLLISIIVLVACLMLFYFVMMSNLMNSIGGFYW